MKTARQQRHENGRLRAENARLTAALAARDEALGKIANYPGTHDIDCGEEDGDDDGECCTLAWMKSLASAALTTPAPAPADGEKGGE